MYEVYVIIGLNLQTNSIKENYILDVVLPVANSYINESILFNYKNILVIGIIVDIIMVGKDQLEMEVRNSVRDRTKEIWI